MHRRRLSARRAKDEHAATDNRLRTAERVFVAVDLSNVHFGSQTSSGARNLAIRLDVRQLVGLLASDSSGRPRQLARQWGAAAASPSRETLCDLWERHGYTIRRLPPGHNGREVGIDEAMHAQIYEWLEAEYPPHVQPVLALLTGDGNPNQGGTTFPRVIEAALRRGWHVELYTWRACTSAVLRTLAAQYDPVVRLIHLDTWREQLTYVQNHNAPAAGATPSPAPAVLPAPPLPTASPAAPFARRPCRHFAAGRCDRGDACGFLHERPAAPAAAATAAPFAQRPCRHFAAGRCNRGDGCGFLHERPVAPPAAAALSGAVAAHPAPTPRSVEERLCVVCLEDPSNTVLLPCGHANFCADCAAVVRRDCCPMCRQSVTAVQRIYF